MFFDDDILKMKNKSNLSLSFIVRNNLIFISFEKEQSVGRGKKKTKKISLAHFQSHN